MLHEHYWDPRFTACFCGKTKAQQWDEDHPVPIDTTGQGHDGSDIVPERDEIRLTGQLRRVWDLMVDGQERSLGQIAEATGDPESSVSAQLRHLRKPRMGGHTVKKRYIDQGLFVYKLIPLERL